MLDVDSISKDLSADAKPFNFDSGLSISVESKDKLFKSRLAVLEYALLGLVAALAIVVTYQTMGSDFHSTAKSSSSSFISLK